MYWRAPARASAARRRSSTRWWRRGLFALIRRIVGVRAVAEDVFQDTMIIVFEQLDRYRGEAPLGAWVGRIALSRSLMFLRSPWHRARVSFGYYAEAEALLAPVHLALPGPDAETLDMERALASLTPTARAVVWLYEVEGWSHEEIAHSFGRTISFSKSQLARAHQRLRDWFEPEASQIMRPDLEPQAIQPMAAPDRLLERLRELPDEAPPYDYSEFSRRYSRRRVRRTPTAAAIGGSRVGGGGRRMVRDPPPGADDQRGGRGCDSAIHRIARVTADRCRAMAGRAAAPSHHSCAHPDGGDRTGRSDRHHGRSAHRRAAVAAAGAASGSPAARSCADWSNPWPRCAMRRAWWQGRPELQCQAFNLG